MDSRSPEIPFEEILASLEVESFDRDAARLMARLDRRSMRVAFDFPRLPLPAGSSSPRSLLGYYRQEVQRIPQMDREEERRLCMGVEFLWRRLKKARRAAGFPREDVERYPGLGSANCVTCPPGRQRLCHGCAPLDLDDERRQRLLLRHREFVDARNELISRHLFIVFRLLHRYRRVAVAEEDLIQEANVSLFKAVEGFDFTRGVRFKTYAGYWVNQAFLNAIYNQSRVVRVPAYIQKAMKKILDAAPAVEGQLADRAGLSRASGVSEDLVRTALNGNRFTLSLDKPIDPASGARMVDLVEEESFAVEPEFGERERLEGHLENALERLDPREQTVLELRFGLGGHQAETLAQVGSKLGVSLERVRQIQKAALQKIRASSESRFLEQYA